MYKITIRKTRSENNTVTLWYKMLWIWFPIQSETFRGLDPKDAKLLLMEVEEMQSDYNIPNSLVQFK